MANSETTLIHDEKILSDPAEMLAFATELEQGEHSLPRQINVDPEGVEKGLAKLVLTVIELLRQLMEKQADLMLRHTLERLVFEGADGFRAFGSPDHAKEVDCRAHAGRHRPLCEQCGLMNRLCRNGQFPFHWIVWCVVRVPSVVNRKSPIANSHGYPPCTGGNRETSSPAFKTQRRS